MNTNMIDKAEPPSKYHEPLNRAQRRHPIARVDAVIVRPNYVADSNARKAARAARKARRAGRS
jgi:hypothetical protein